MAIDGTLLQGQVIDNPGTEELDVEGLLLGFLQALAAEQKGDS